MAAGNGTYLGKRRGFLAGSSALAAGLFLPLTARAQKVDSSTTCAATCASTASP